MGPAIYFSDRALSLSIPYGINRRKIKRTISARQRSSGKKRTRILRISSRHKAIQFRDDRRYEATKIVGGLGGD